MYLIFILVYLYYSLSAAFQPTCANVHCTVGSYALLSVCLIAAKKKHISKGIVPSS